MSFSNQCKNKLTACGLVAALVAFGSVSPAVYADRSEHSAGKHLIKGEILPTGMRITPTVAAGSVFVPLNPDLPTRPDYLADHAVDAVISPDGKTLLVLTSGYNRMNDENGSRIQEESNEYVFVYDISQGAPVKQQVIQVPNTFNGIAWNPNGEEFYVSGGVNDNLHIYGRYGSSWTEVGEPAALGHDNTGEGVNVRPLAAGVAVNASGTRVLVANYENDSISLIDTLNRIEVSELDLRPGIANPALSGTAGGTYPLAVIFKGDNQAYVTSQRDREIIVVSLDGDDMRVEKRISTRGQPTKMTMNRAQTQLYVACDNDDSVVIVDTVKNQILETVATIAPESVFDNEDKLRGANPNNVTLSPDEGTLFVTNGGTSSVAVIQLAHAVMHDEDDDDDHKGKGRKKHREDEDDRENRSKVIGLIPTGWYPNAVASSQNMLYVVNGKSNAGPNPDACRDTVSIESGSLNTCRGANQYVWQLHKAGLLSLPVPSARELASLTWQVAANNKFPKTVKHRHSQEMMKFLRGKIEHVVYIVKENRTYDQVLGSLEMGNGDPDLAILAPYSPNHLQLARQFVTLDNFYDSGETSNTGWNWTTAARATDFTEKTSPVNYAGRGLTYDWEGANRNVPVSLSYEERVALGYPEDPNMLAGSADVAAPDSAEGETGAGYLWDAALRAGLSIRNYGFYVQNQGSLNDLTEDQAAKPYENRLIQAVARKQALAPHTDPYFRGYDQANSDVILSTEWEREFDQYVEKGQLPNLTFIRFPHDHFGSFSTAKWGVNTVEAQMADNDFAVARVIEKIANSRFRDNTLIFVIEDDAQNGGDHVDAHRSFAYIVGPYVKQGGDVISTHYTTASMLRTIVDVLGLEPLGINDGLSEPMAEVFDRKQKRWNYTAIVPEILYSTRLPLPDPQTAPVSNSIASCDKSSVRSSQYWNNAMKGQDFTTEDNLDTEAFNTALWNGLKGEDTPQPGRHGRDLRDNREQLLARYRADQQEKCQRMVSSESQ